MMFAKVLATAVSLGAIGGATLAVAHNTAGPAPLESASTSAPLASVGLNHNSCEEVAFRVYFAPGSSALDDDARTTIATAARDVDQCAAVDVTMAADMTRIDTTSERRLSAQRSVIVLGEVRRHGVTGEVYIAPVSDVVMAAEANAGPDFVELSFSPSAGGQLLSSVTNVESEM